MRKQITLIRGFVAILALLLLISSCRFLKTTEIGEPRMIRQAVELGSARAATVRIDMPVGELTVKGGADGLAQGTFRINAVNWEPRMNYGVNGDEGLLVVDKPNAEIPLGGELVNQWDLLLSNTVPIKLEINAAAVEAELDLRGLNLIDLVIEADAGDTIVDLSSALDHDLRVTINGGMGEISVKLPTEMGVQVSADTGIGGLTSGGLMRDGDKYVNDAFGEAAHTLYLDISAGVGAIELLEQ